MKVEDYAIPASIEDRIALIERLWASIDEDNLPPLSKAQMQLVNERIKLVDQGLRGAPANEVLERLRGKHLA